MPKLREVLLSSKRIHELIEEGVIEGAKHEHVNGASLDLVLGDYVLVENYPLADDRLVISIDRRDELPVVKHLTTPHYLLRPGGFCLSYTRELFHFPRTLSGEYKCKSSMCRVGLDHLNAGWCDPGWHNSALTLELKNELQYHTLELKAGMKCGQMVFFEHLEVPSEDAYDTKGRYNGDREVSGVKL